MPRGGHGRGRPRKRDSRRDAAVDAMMPYGYPEELVISTVNQLLEVYGEDGWPFIEEASYSVLLEALFAKEDEQTDKNVKKDDLLGSDNMALAAGSTGTRGSVSAAAKSPGIAKPTEASVLNAEGEGSKNMNANQDHEKNRTNNAQVTRNVGNNGSHCLVEEKAFPMPSRGFYHGWFSDSNEPLELVQLKSAPLKFLAGGILKNRNRRWDQIPSNHRNSNGFC